jgi:hypothetical protein
LLAIFGENHESQAAICLTESIKSVEGMFFPIAYRLLLSLFTRSSIILGLFILKINISFRIKQSSRLQGMYSFLLIILSTVNS